MCAWCVFMLTSTPCWFPAFHVPHLRLVTSPAALHLYLSETAFYNCLSPGPLFPGEFQQSFCFVSLESQWVTLACSPPVLDSSSGLVPLPWPTTDLVMTSQTECTTLRACAEFPPFVIPLVPINITFWFTLSTNTVKRKYRCNLLFFVALFLGNQFPFSRLNKTTVHMCTLLLSRRPVASWSYVFANHEDVGLIWNME